MEENQYPKSIDVLGNKIPVTYDMNNELLIVLETKQDELLTKLINDIEDAHSSYVYIGGSPKSFIYPTSVSGLLVSKKTEATYFILAGKKKTTKNVIDSIHQAVEKHFSESDIDHEEIVKSGSENETNYIYIGQKRTLAQKIAGGGLNLLKGLLG